MKQVFFLFFTLFMIGFVSPSWTQIDQELWNEIKAETHRLMKKGDIPGLSMVIIQGESVQLESFGYANLSTKTLVDTKTIFEIGSCTKAFTGLAILKLEQAGLLEMDSPVSDYLPWFRPTYQGKAVEVSLRDLLYHTSGIPWESISDIPQSAADSALVQTVRAMSDIELTAAPGTTFEYATVNYDILGLVIQLQSGQSYEAYVQEQILEPIGMGSTSIGAVSGLPKEAQGHKIGFFAPRAYASPVFKGNHPAGYVATTAEDLAKWIQLQLGVGQRVSQLDSLIAISHQRDTRVAPNYLEGLLASYAAGWMVSLEGDGKVIHSGLNPNFTASISIFPEKQIGLGIMANANSPYTSELNHQISRLLTGGELAKDVPKTNLDQTFSIISICLWMYLVLLLVFIAKKLVDLRHGTSRWVAAKLGIGILPHLGMLMLSAIPIFWGIYLLPEAMAEFSWSSVKVWAPISFMAMVYSLIAALVMSYVAYLVNRLIQGSNQYLTAIPPLMVLSLLAGIANSAVIILVSTAVNKDAEEDLSLLLFYFFLTFAIYIGGRKIVETRLIQLTLDLVYDFRMRMINKIFSTSYQNFEKMERGRIYATLNDDTNMVGNSASIIMNLLTSFITTIAAFSYLLMISFKTSLITIAVVVGIATMYFLVSRASNPLFETARDTAASYMHMLNGLIDGFRELSLHLAKRLGYKDELMEINRLYKEKLLKARVAFINSFLTGESMLVGTLAMIAFALPKLFPNIEAGVATSFVIVMLYLIGPVNNILTSIPTLMQVRISWNRIQTLLAEIPISIELEQLEQNRSNLKRIEEIESFALSEISYAYPKTTSEDGFTLGPIGFEVGKGEALFLVGGMGVGKPHWPRSSQGCMKVMKERF